MTWLACRQFRTSAIAAAFALGLVAILLALTPSAELFGCVGQVGCPDAHSFLHMHHDHLVRIFSTLLVGLPAIVGAFWGAPMVARELESGTYRLAWTQSVSRTQWLTTKLAVVGLAAVAVCGAWSLALGLWSNAAMNADRLQPSTFAERGIVPMGYAVFAVALGVAVGLIVRRAIAAMAVTLVGFTAVRLATAYLLRPHLFPARHAALAVKGVGLEVMPNGTERLLPEPVTIGNAWVESTKLVDGSGHGPTTAFARQACAAPLQRLAPPSGPSARADAQSAAQFHACVAQVAARFHLAVTYQPISHYWALQGAETAAFLALAAGMIAFCFWWVRRRLT
jgi:hypothetical protein